MGGLLERLKGSAPARFYAKWSADHAADGAVLIAWQGVLSVFPLILGMLSILGYVLRDPATREPIVQGIASQFPSQVGDLLGFLEETRDLGGLLGTISVLGLLWSGSNLFGAMAGVFNRFYGVEDRGFVRQRLMAFVMIAIYAVLIPLSVVASGVSTFLVGVSEQVLPFRVPGSTLVVGWLVSLGSAGLMFLALYRIVPNIDLGFRDVWRGALLATVLFVALSQAFPLYLSLLGGGFAVYKTLGVFFLLMTWFYFVSNVIVAGAELNAFSGGHGAPETSEVDHRSDRPRGRLAADGGREPDAPAGRPPVRPSPVPAVHVRRSTSKPRPSVWKTVAWAGVAAGVAGVTWTLVRKAAGGIWRAAGQEE
jgi:membrane protein